MPLLAPALWGLFATLIPALASSQQRPASPAPMARVWTNSLGMVFVRIPAGMDNPSRSGEFETRTYTAFKAAFEAQYAGGRLPLQLGFHFVEMNGGAYWRAMERLVTDVCHRADVACVSYSEAIDLLAKQPAGPRS